MTHHNRKPSVDPLTGWQALAIAVLGVALILSGWL